MTGIQYTQEPNTDVAAGGGGGGGGEGVKKTEKKYIGHVDLNHYYSDMLFLPTFIGFTVWHKKYLRWRFLRLKLMV
jgi:hypothetical protein